MEDKTKEILDEINNETTEIIIYDNEVEGIINFKKFKNLTKISCGFNQITKICG